MADSPDWAAQLLARPFRPDAVAKIVFETKSPWFHEKVKPFVPKNRGVDPSDFIANVLLALYEKLRDGHFSPDEPTAWVLTALKNLARDERRKCLAEKRGGKATHVDEEALDMTPASVDDPASVIDRKSWTLRVLDFSTPDEVTPNQRLAFLACHWFRAVTWLHVEQAARPTARARTGTTGGLVRTAEDTWERLERLRAEFPEGVLDDDSGREALAYILRNASSEAEPNWQNPRMREAALDTVRQWVTRYARRVRTQLEEVAS
jgi:DNA-directed RNA polymerase specialized sigma24 family protein